MTTTHAGMVAFALVIVWAIVMWLLLRWAQANAALQAARRPVEQPARTRPAAPVAVPVEQPIAVPDWPVRQRKEAHA